MRRESARVQSSRALPAAEAHMQDRCTLSLRSGPPQHLALAVQAPAKHTARACKTGAPRARSARASPAARPARARRARAAARTAAPRHAGRRGVGRRRRRGQPRPQTARRRRRSRGRARCAPVAPPPPRRPPRRRAAPRRPPPRAARRQRRGQRPPRRRRCGRRRAARRRARGRCRARQVPACRRLRRAWQLVALRPGRRVPCRGPLCGLTLMHPAGRPRRDFRRVRQP